MNSRRRSRRKPIWSDSMAAGLALGYALSKLSDKERHQPRSPPHVLAIGLAEGLDERPLLDLDPVRDPRQGQHEAGQGEPVGGAQKNAQDGEEDAAVARMANVLVG